MLFKKHHNGVLLKFLEAHDLEKELRDLDDGPSGGHFTDDTIVNKVMWDSFIGPHYSRMLTHMLTSVQCIRSVLVEERSQAPHCILSKWKNHFNNGA